MGSNRRLRASVWLESRGKSILIDTATDLREQALRHKIFHVDAVLYTPPHADHVGGIEHRLHLRFVGDVRRNEFGSATKAGGDFDAI